MLTDNYFLLIPRDNESYAYLVNADGTIIFTIKMNSLDPSILSLNRQFTFFKGSVYSVSKDDVSKLMMLYHLHSMTLERYVKKSGPFRMIMMPSTNDPSNSLYYQFVMAHSYYGTESIYINLISNLMLTNNEYMRYNTENLIIDYSVDIENKLYAVFNTLRDAILDMSSKGTYVMILNSSDIKKSNLLNFVKK